jgi:hypothetical protein
MISAGELRGMGAVSAWRMANALTWVDVISGFNATFHSSVSVDRRHWTESTPRFGSSSSTGDVTYNAALAPTANTTFAAWVYINAVPDGSTTNMGGWWGNETSTAFSALWRLGSGGNSSLARRIGINFNTGVNNDTENNNNLPIQTWVHVAVTTDGATARWYINGRLDTAKAYAITPRASTDNFRFGVGNFGRFFTGSLSFPVYSSNRTFTPADVRTVFNETNPRGRDRLVFRLTPIAGGGGFQSSWAAYSNQIIGPGVGAI